MKRWVAWLVRVSGTVAILWLIFRQVPIREVGSALLGARLGYVVLGLALAVSVRYLAAYQTKVLTDAQRMSLSVREIFAISCATSFYGLLLPGVLAGGAIRWYKLSRPDRKPAQGLVVIVVDRLLTALMVIVIGVAGWVADRGPASQPAVGWGLVTVLGGLLLCYGLVFHQRGSELIWGRLAGARALPEPIRSKLRKVGEAALQYHRLPAGSIFHLVGMALLRNGLGILAASCMTQSLRMDLSLVTIAWVRSVILLASMLPITIAGLGAREATVVVLLRPYGILPTDAVAWGLLSFAGTLCVAGIGGFLEARHVVRRGSHQAKQPASAIQPDAKLAVDSLPASPST